MTSIVVEHSELKPQKQPEHKNEIDKIRHGISFYSLFQAMVWHGLHYSWHCVFNAHANIVSNTEF